MEFSLEKENSTQFREDGEVKKSYLNYNLKGKHDIILSLITLLSTQVQMNFFFIKATSSDSFPSHSCLPLPFYFFFKMHFHATWSC